MKRLWLAGLVLFAALPATSNYGLNNYGFGPAGGTSTTANYALEGTVGEVSNSAPNTANYTAEPGYVSTQQANVPAIASFDNNGGIYYNKLHFVLDQQSNPTDATYALSISTDNFSSDIRYVKSDLTVGSSLTLTDYQTYVAWGGATGSVVTGLLPGTTYYLRAKATQGQYTESQYGPITSVATASPTITFSVTTSAQASPPFSINFGTVLASTVTDSPDTINVGLSTNAVSGANVYIVGSNTGLHSTTVSNTITSASADLSVAASGFGAKNTAISQSSGGPFTVLSPFNGASNNVGVINTTSAGLYTSAGPLNNGAASLLLKVKTTNQTIAASDYQEILTLVAAGNF